jgi:hypothetical protein
VLLNLLSAPTSIGLTHVRGRLNGRDELKRRVSDTNKADDRTPDDLPDRVAVEDDGADEDVENTASQEAEEEGGVARDLRWDLELEQAVDQTEEDDVYA